MSKSITKRVRWAEIEVEGTDEWSSENHQFVDAVLRADTPDNLCEAFNALQAAHPDYWDIFLMHSFKHNPKAKRGVWSTDVQIVPADSWNLFHEDVRGDDISTLVEMIGDAMFDPIKFLQGSKVVTLRKAA